MFERCAAKDASLDRDSVLKMTHAHSIRIRFQALENH
jgi:hypothetical protein